MQLRITFTQKEMKNQHKTGQKTLVSVHGYIGDKHQVMELLPYYQHHECPIVIISPSDSQIHGIGAHICRHAGKRAYTGQISLDRQWAQMKILLEYPFDFYLMNDADSFCITADIPQYLYDTKNHLFSNEVDDFRIPGQSWQGLPPWPLDYHKGMPLLAFQPPYFLSREAVEKIVNAGPSIIACPICPFIDWGMVQVTQAAGVGHKRYNHCASCETSTANGLAVMSECVSKRAATFVHSIKKGSIAKQLVDLYKASHG